MVKKFKDLKIGDYIYVYEYNLKLLIKYEIIEIKDIMDFYKGYCKKYDIKSLDVPEQIYTDISLPYGVLEDTSYDNDFYKALTDLTML